MSDEPDKSDKPDEEPLANAGTEHTGTNLIVWGFTIFVVFVLIKPYLATLLVWILTP